MIKSVRGFNYEVQSPRTLLPGVSLAPRSSPVVLQVGTPSRCSYGYVKPFRGNSGVRTADGPMMGHSLQRASSYQVTRLQEIGESGRGPAYRVQVRLIDERRMVSQIHGPGI